MFGTSVALGTGSCKLGVCESSVRVFYSVILFKFYYISLAITVIIHHSAKVFFTISCPMYIN